MTSRSTKIGALVFLGAAGLTPLLPVWIISLAIVALANALVVLGLMILWRAGLVPFGQALFYAIGGYAVALIAHYTCLRDALLLLTLAAILSGFAAFIAGFLLARYREIFFAMLSLAMSMIFYGVLVKTGTLGSTDGFHVEQPTYVGYVPQSTMRLFLMFWLVLTCCALAALLVSLYLRSVAGALAVTVRDSEIRLEFLGVSVNRLIHLNLVIAGTLAGIGGGLAALAIEHVDPDMAYWTTSGGFVFVTILAGTRFVAAAFFGSLLFELLRSIGYDIFPGTWQMFLGSTLLLIILFLPEGIGSLFQRVPLPPTSTGERDCMRL
jgi:ABC-type branched-subunit amino acid transport system permease subunit